MFKTKVQTQSIETNEWEQSRHIQLILVRRFHFKMPETQLN